MKKRFLAFLLAVCVAVSMLVLPASAVGSNAAVQTATALGGLTAGQVASSQHSLLTAIPPRHRAAPAASTAMWTATLPMRSTSAPLSRTAG